MISDDEVWLPRYTIFGFEVQKTDLAPGVLLHLGIEQDFQTIREANIYSTKSYIIASDARYEARWLFEGSCRTSSKTWCRKEQ